MKKTCGIYLVNKNNKLLITHPTNHPEWRTWSVPKGEPSEEDESFLNTAIRELYDETGISIYNDLQLLNDNYKLYYLPTVIYKSNKKMFYNFLLIDKNLDDVPVICNSLFKSNVDGKEYPENDDYKWVHMSHIYMLKQYLHEAQVENLGEIVNILNLE